MASITDIPIKSIEQDLLQIKTYSTALSDFIFESDTPITIGLQGEWGTGKTSLMAILLEDLSRRKVATSWVNTWEYSLFRSSREITPKVLKGMLDHLERNCKDRGLWEHADDIDKTAKKVGRLLGNIANQVIAAQTGVNILGTGDNESEADIAQIKQDITLIIQRIIHSPNNPVPKVVFFLDDLDRIPPADAVELLEALKNVFDIPNCVFILAIDYDVVVKGLETKFGAKTEKNEREFRSFFDKIIQVPFSMPVGVYSMEAFLKKKLKDLGVTIDSDEGPIYAKIVKLTTGSNPRSLKRYLNSFSLIDKVRTLQSASSNDLMLFALLGIQVSFPQVFRLISQEPDYVHWTKAFAAKKNIDMDEVERQLPAYEENELVDELWERIVWAICQKDPYLKARAFEILELMNLLREQFRDDLSDELELALDYASITSVDDDAEAKQTSQRVGRKTLFSSLEAKLEQLLQYQVPDQTIAIYRGMLETFLAAQRQHPNLSVSLAKTQTTIANTDYSQGKVVLAIANPGKRDLGINLSIVNKFVGDFYSELTHVIHKAGPIESSKLASLVKVSNNGNLYIRGKLGQVIPSETYQEMLDHVVAHVVQCCAKA